MWIPLESYLERSKELTGVMISPVSLNGLRPRVILLLFDPHKLDISDEFKRVISSLRGHEDKIRVVLNKADQVSTQQVKELTYIILIII